MAEALLLPLLLGGGAGLGAGILAKLFPALGGSYSNVNTDYAQNPIYDLMFGAGGGYGRANAGMEGMLGKAEGAALAYDPTAFWKDFMRAQPELADLISGGTGSVRSEMQSNLDNFIKQAVAGTGSQLSGMGSLYSGAFGDILGKSVGAEAGKSGVDLAQLQAGLYGSAWNSMLPLFSGQRSNQLGQLLNTYLTGAGLFGNQANTMLGLGANLSSPVYAQQPGILDYLMQGAGLGLQFGGASAMLPRAAAPAASTPAYFNPYVNSLIPSGVGSFSLNSSPYNWIGRPGAGY